MKAHRRSDDREAHMRKLLAYSEERQLLYREMVKLQEQLLEDLVSEVIGTKEQRANAEVEAEMEKWAGTGPQSDV